MPSYSQSVRLRKLCDYGALSDEAMIEIMSEEKDLIEVDDTECIKFILNNLPEELKGKIISTTNMMLKANLSYKKTIVSDKDG